MLGWALSRGCPVGSGASVLQGVGAKEAQGMLTEQLLAGNGSDLEKRDSGQLSGSDK